MSREGRRAVRVAWTRRPNEGEKLRHAAPQATNDKAETADGDAVGLLVYQVAC